MKVQKCLGCNQSTKFLFAQNKNRHVAICSLSQSVAHFVFARPVDRKSTRYVFKNPVTVNLRCGTLFLVARALGNLMDRLSIGAVVDYWYLRVILPIIPHISLYFNLSDLSDLSWAE